MAGDRHPALMQQLYRIELLVESLPARVKWDGANTPDQARYWSPILADWGIEGAITKLYELAVIWTNRAACHDPGFDLRTAFRLTLQACLQAAMRHGAPS